jgi:hypothetical protein
MRWPQTPDLAPEGVAVKMPLMAIRADDFRCTESGYITGIHIWGSFENDVLPALGPGGLTFTLSIWSDVPPYTPGTPGYPYSMPGVKLWDKIFPPGGYTVRDAAENTSEGWYDPEAWIYTANDHDMVYQYNFDIAIADAYQQEESNIYWLGVQHYVTLPGRFGWKCTDPSLQWNDNAVRHTTAGWIPLEYPTDHIFAGLPLDFAFVINGTAVPTFTLPPWHFTPLTLNLWSRGRWVAGKMTLPAGYDISDVDISTVRLEDRIPADRCMVTGDSLTLKFDRSELEDMVMGGAPPIKPAEFKISGRLTDGTQFIGYSNTITFTGLE